MDINNNIQINTFSKGMNTDTSDALLDSLEYRYARNVRLVTINNQNDGELLMIYGAEPTSIYNKFKDIYATSSIRNYGIIIGKEDNLNGWGIYVFENGYEANIKMVFGPCTELLGDYISVVTRYESENNIKLYMADGEHQLMSINIMHDDYTNEQPPSAIEYISKEDSNIPQITASLSNNIGHLKSAVVQYACTLYIKNGEQSKMSPLSKPISLYNNDKGYKQDEITNNSVDLSFSHQDSYYDRIKVFRITYVQNGQLPEIHVIADRKFTGSFNFNDTGDNISQISYAEFISISGIDIKPKLIESKENTLFCANIEYDQKEIDELFERAIVTFDYYVSNTGYTFDSYGNYSSGYERTLMPGETYRYGIVFYDKKGRKTSVLHITDVTVPESLNNISIDSTETDESGFTTKVTYSVHPIGVSVNIILPTIDLLSECTGYEVVRCDRTVNDSNIIMQGIVGCTYREAGETDFKEYNNRYAVSYMTLWDSCVRSSLFIPTRFRTSGDLVVFASPDYLYDKDNYKNAFDFLGNRLSLHVDDTMFITNKRYLGEDAGYKFAVGDSNDHNFIFDLKTSEFRNVYVNGTLDEKLYSGSDVYYVENFATIDSDYRINNAYIYPTRILNRSSFGDENSFSISSIKYIESPDPFKFDTDGSISIQNDSTVIENLKYINWETNNLYNDGRYNDDQFIDSHNEDPYFLRQKVNLISSGKSGMLIKLQGDGISTRSAYTLDDGQHSNIIPISVATVRNNNVTPYGGTSDVAKNNSIFYSFGDYFDVNENITLENFHYYLNGRSYTQHILDGDCYAGLFVYNSSHAYSSVTYKYSTNAIVYAVPMYSKIDLKATYGDLYPKLSSGKRYYFQDTPVSMYGYNLEHSAYLYNTAYSQTPTAGIFSTTDWDLNLSESFDTRVVYSNEKTNNELIDNWLIFKSANYQDVDTRYGEITNLRLFKNALMFWLEHATGALSVNERTIIQDANDTNIILGNGDILQRYDYMSTLYGMHRNDGSDTQSDSTLYWWDRNNKEIVAYGGGQTVQPLNKVKNVSNYIRSNQSLEKPSLAYDQDTKEVLFNVVKDNLEERCLVYSEIIQSFSGVYDTPFEDSIQLSNDLYFIKDNKISKKVKSKPINPKSTTNEAIFPLIKYVVNKDPMYNKTFDILTFGGRLYGGDEDDILDLTLRFSTPLKQSSEITGDSITNREYDFRLTIPRNNNSKYGDRMRGKTMQCEIESASSSTDFSLQYITTKYRMSWS